MRQRVPLTFVGVVCATLAGVGGAGHRALGRGDAGAVERVAAVALAPVLDPRHLLLLVGADLSETTLKLN